MTTKTALASQSLLLLGAGAISSFAEGSNEAEIVKSFYEDFIKDALSRYPWSFALRRKRLTLSPETPVNQWRYKYHEDPATLRTFGLYNSDNVGAQPLLGGWARQGKHYLTNYKPLYAEFTTRVGEGDFPAYFVEYAKYAFAAILAVPVAGEESLAERRHIAAYGSPSERETGGKFGVATSIDAQQTPDLPVAYSPELVAARFS